MASAVDAATVILNDIKTLLANVVSTFPIKGNLVSNNGIKLYLKILFYVIKCLITLF